MTTFLASFLPLLKSWCMNGVGVAIQMSSLWGRITIPSDVVKLQLPEADAWPILKNGGLCNKAWRSQNDDTDYGVIMKTACLCNDIMTSEASMFPSILIPSWMPSRRDAQSYSLTTTAYKLQLFLGNQCISQIIQVRLSGSSKLSFVL